MRLFKHAALLLLVVPLVALATGQVSDNGDVEPSGTRSHVYVVGPGTDPGDGPGEPGGTDRTNVFVPTPPGTTTNSFPWTTGHAAGCRYQILYLGSQIGRTGPISWLAWQCATVNFMALRGFVWVV